MPEKHNVGDRIISYLTGRLIEKCPSAVSGELEVWYQNGRHVLHSPDANYSFDTLHQVFQRAFKKLDIRGRNPRHVLILGFGAGSVASILCDELKLTPSITGVELDPEVIRLARKYFELDHFSNLKIEVDDAVTFVSQCHSNFDLVVSDVFVDKVIPGQILSEGYVKNLIRLTMEGGMGMMNLIVESKAQREQKQKLMNHLHSAGAHVETIKTSSINYMLVWKKGS